MSSFIVENDTINAVVNFLSRNDDIAWQRGQIKEKYGADLETPMGREKLGRIMYKMNCTATAGRYHGNIDDMVGEPYVCRIMGGITKYDALKALSCWLYQCSEDPVYDSDNYTFFASLKGDIAYEIASRSDAFEASNYWR